MIPIYPSQPSPHQNTPGVSWSERWAEQRERALRAEAENRDLRATADRAEDDLREVRAENRELRARLEEAFDVQPERPNDAVLDGVRGDYEVMDLIVKNPGYDGKAIKAEAWQAMNEMARARRARAFLARSSEGNTDG